MLGAATQQLVQRPGRGIQFDSLVALALGDLFRPHENPRPGALRAGITAPDPSSQHRDEEQAEGGDDQYCGKKDEILRPEGAAEDMKLACAEIP
ncbi:hypothetical protein D3C72_2224440 [compost metagenome]